ncbi:MAG: HMA2 domain-containing protein [Hyphomicrobiales bacterium]
MHLVTALILASSLLKKKNNKPFKGFYNIIELKHYLPGRMRLYVPDLKSNSDNKELLEAQLPKIKAIKSFDVNIITASILLNYDADAVEDTVIFGLIIQLLGLEQKIQEDIPAKLTKGLLQFESNLNRSIYERSNGLVDLRSGLITGFVLLATIGFFGKNIKKPSPYNLLYWAYIGISRGIR